MQLLTCWLEFVQGFCKEFLTWKALKHPNVLPLLGVEMTEGQFAMVSEWMPNGNVNQFVAAHPDANPFELVGFPFKPLPPLLIIGYYVISVVGRCRKGFDLYARSGNDPRGSKGGVSSRAATTTTDHLPALVC